MKSDREPPAPGPEGPLSPATLAELVSNALEMRDEGRADWLAAACERHPEAQAAVRAAVEQADELPGLIGRTGEHDPMHGQALGGRFRLLERIGVGSMGVVYLAEDQDLHRKVACKVVHHGLMAPRQALERFAREAEAMAAVQHPAVVTIHDRGRTETDQVYIVMELIDGPPLSEFLNAARARPDSVRSDDGAWIRTELGVATEETSYVRTVVRWVADLALGLEAVHKAGVLHRDIKPSNILMRKDGRPVLLDFGIALLDEQNSGTRTPTSVGTPAYMPPEALRRDVQRSAPSDVYGLAATLYHLLTLHAPYEGTPTQILTALATRDPIPAVQLRPGLPRDLQAVLDRGMHRSPARRYASAAEFEADLRAFLEYRPVTARPVTSLERVMRRLVRSRAAMGALAALVVVALVLGGLAWREHALDGRRERWTELSRHFPPNFTVVGAANREVRDAADRADLSRLLDEAADVAVQPLPTLLLRASFRQDHGDPDGAARDMRVVADDVHTELARELATRYERADREKRGVGAIDLEQLPAPATAVDRYLLGYHCLRKYPDDPLALELLGDPEVRRIAHAEELFLAFTVIKSPIGPEDLRVAGERYEDVLKLEGRIGMRTAATAHVASRMLSVLRRHEDSLDVSTAGIALAPRAHVLRINAGWCAFVLGKNALAREHLEVGHELKPQYAHIVQNLVWVDVAEKRFDEALARVRSAAPGLVPANPWWIDYYSAMVATYAALDADPTDHADDRARWLETARTCFARVPDKHLKDAQGRPDDALNIARALELGDPEGVFVAVAEFLATSPRDWWRQQLVLRNFPEDLGPLETAAMRGVLEKLAQSTNTGPSK